MKLSAGLALCALLLETLCLAPRTAQAQDLTVMSIGQNFYGQLGIGTKGKPKLKAVRVPNLSNVLSVAGGWTHSLALTRGGAVFSWGENNHGQLGDGTKINRSSPVQVPNLPGNIIQIAVAGYHSLALSSDGTVYSWGEGASGQNGTGTNNDITTPVAIGGLPFIASIGAGENHSLAVEPDKPGVLAAQIWGWGLNSHGCLGVGDDTPRNKPDKRTSLTGMARVAGGGIHSVALRLNGELWAVGGNNAGQVGDGNDQRDHLGWTQLLGGKDSFAQVAAADRFSMALHQDGTVWAWGANGHGQIGDNSNTLSLVPKSVAGFGENNKATQIATLNDTAVAVTEDGAVWAWGGNSDGQLGLGNQVDKWYPTLVPNLPRAVTVGCGGSHTLIVVRGISLDFTLPNARYSGMYGDYVALKAKLSSTLPNKDGIANRVIHFYIGGMEVGTSVTDLSGQAKLSIKIPDSLTIGEHIVSAYFGGDATYLPIATPVSGNATLTTYQTSTRITSNDITAKRGAVVPLKAQLRRTSDKLGLSGKSILFLMDSVVIVDPKNPATTDGNGLATLFFTVPKNDANWKIGSVHKVTALFGDTEQYDGSEKTFTITVK